MKSVHSTGWNRLEPPSPSSPLVAAIEQYLNLERRRFHVPAHSGFSPLPQGLDLVRRDPFRYDLTEVEGLDVLSEPAGCLLEAQRRAAGLYGVAHSYFLVNGASVGLMAAMLSVAGPGDQVLLPRNVHRSVLGGLILSGAEPVWMLPEALEDWGLWGAVSVESVQAALRAHPRVKALFLSAPTYEGLGSDVAALAETCRARGVKLVVDEAHGGLWPFSEAMPPSACQMKVDAVIHSLHKSVGSLTQTALAHLPHGSGIDPAGFQQALNLLHTTSPSYLLMANLDATIGWLGGEDFRARLRAWLLSVSELRQDLQRELKVLRLFVPPQEQFWDPAKLYFVHPFESGEDWGPRLEETGPVAYESASPYGVLYLANIGLGPEDYAAFRRAMLAEDARWQANPESEIREPLAIKDFARHAVLPEMAMTPREAFFAPGEAIPSVAAQGRVAKETVVHCPPGIPVLMPGERIQARHVPLLPETVMVLS